MQGIAELETQIQTSIEDHKNARAINTFLKVTTFHLKSPHGAGQLGDCEIAVAGL